MSGAQPTHRAITLVCLLALGISLGAAQSTSKYLFQLESHDAFPDSTLPETVYSFFDDTDESPLESASIDLNGDGKKEKFVPNKFLEGTGLCPWIVLDPNGGRLLARIDAKVIFVLKAKKAGYALIEAYQRHGGDRGYVSYFEFNGHEYIKKDGQELKGEEINKYFEQRMKIPHPR